MNSRGLNVNEVNTTEDQCDEKNNENRQSTSMLSATDIENVVSADLNVQSALDDEVTRMLQEAQYNGENYTAEEELELVIGYCLRKLQNPDNLEITWKKDLMKKLVESRLKLDSLKDACVSGELLHIRTYQNHEFIVQSARGRNPYCEVCMSTIWRLIQRWRKCRVCGIRVHDKCIEGVVRKCVGAVACDPDFRVAMKICPEQGLDAQNYACAECKRPLQFGASAEVEPRLCDYSGLYYCNHCHWNDEWMIPARVVNNWDCNKYKVCRASKQLLAYIDRKPLYNLSQVNPRLLTFVAQLNKINKLRHDIMYMKCYFMCCKEAKRLRILQYLNRRQHFVESAEWYSLMDLRDLIDGRLLPEIETIVSVFTAHITRDCVICQGNGFICELCPDDNVIYPFSEGVSICHECCAVFHRHCFDVASKRCPRKNVVVMSIESVPRDLRNLRACLLCSMVKSLDQFVLDGCDNCERYLNMKGDEDKVSECTSSNFDGIIAAASPEDSWVCKWQKINRKVKGIYAVSVSGSLPSHIVQELKAQNVRYVPNMRDTTEKL
uniref:Transcription elongation factor SPT4 n=1 Tax=Syphacia muris TaxID=451379 RepID=A0A0N5AHF7_9BILA